MQEELAAEASCAPAEEALPGRRGEFPTARLQTTDGTESISYQLIDGYVVYQGDIVLGRLSGQFTAQSVTLKSATWASCVIPYEINPDLPNRKRVTDAIDPQASRSGVRLVPHKSQTVLWDNIQPSQKSNFDKYRSGSGRDVGALDFNSIMIYGTDFLWRNGKPTLVHKDGSRLNAQRTALSSGDLNGAAKLCGG